MTDIPMGGFTPRPFPIPVVAQEDGPCPRALHEQAREKLFPFYKDAANEVRSWRREAYEAGQRRKATHNPLRWLMAMGDQLYAKAEQHWASQRLAVIATHVDNAAVNRHLGWSPEAAAPLCQPQAATRSTASVVTAFVTAGAVMMAQTGIETVPFTADQRFEAALAFGAICGSGGGDNKREALCHAPKMTLRRKTLGIGGENTLA